MPQVYTIHDLHVTVSRWHMIRITKLLFTHVVVARQEGKKKIGGLPLRSSNVENLLLQMVYSKWGDESYKLLMLLQSSIETNSLPN